MAADVVVVVCGVVLCFFGLGWVGLGGVGWGGVECIEITHRRLWGTDVVVVVAVFVVVVVWGFDTLLGRVLGGAGIWCHGTSYSSSSTVMVVVMVLAWSSRATCLCQAVNECEHPPAVLVLYLQCTPSTFFLVTFCPVLCFSYHFCALWQFYLQGP